MKISQFLLKLKNLKHKGFALLFGTGKPCMMPNVQPIFTNGFSTCHHYVARGGSGDTKYEFLIRGCILTQIKGTWKRSPSFKVPSSSKQSISAINPASSGGPQAQSRLTERSGHGPLAHPGPPPAEGPALSLGTGAAGRGPAEVASAPTS